jgi:osmotically-inducible protein OsmY
MWSKLGAEVSEGRPQINIGEIKYPLVVTDDGDLAGASIRSDQELEREIREDVVGGAFLWCSPGYVKVDVRGGEVTLSGEVESEDVVTLLVSGAERVLGVRSVRNELKTGSRPGQSR